MITEIRIDFIKSGIDIVLDEDFDRYKVVKIDDPDGYRTMVAAHNKIQVDIEDVGTDGDAMDIGARKGVIYHDGEFVAGIKNTFTGWKKLYFGK